MSRVLAANLAIFALSFAAGAWTSASWDAQRSMPFTPGVLDPVARPYPVILSANGVVMLQLLAGAVSAGVFSAMLLGMLGFRIGADTVSVSLLWPDAFGWWATFVVFEYAAFMMTATVAGAFGVDLARWMLGSGQLRPARFAMGLGAAVACALVGAAIEVWCILTFGRGTA
jgi:hypothetical protein